MSKSCWTTITLARERNKYTNKAPSDEGAGFLRSKKTGGEKLPLSQKSKIFDSSPDKGSLLCTDQTLAGIGEGVEGIAGDHAA